MLGCSSRKNESGCGSTQGDLGTMRFSYEAETVECNGICEVTTPIMVGAEVKMRAFGEVTESNLDVRSTLVETLSFSKRDETHECVSKKKDEAGHEVDVPRPVGVGVECDDGEEPRATITFTAKARRSGSAKVEVIADDDVLDSLTINASEATGLVVPASVSVKVGGTATLQVTVKDSTGATLIPGLDGITTASADAAVATITRAGASKQASFTVKGIAVGTTSITVRAGTLEKLVVATVEAGS